MRVAIIGAGFGGIAAGVKLQQAGLYDFVIFEKSSGIGGTWWDNRYPGAATDAASHIYSYSFAPHDWHRTHVGQQELQRYLEMVADRFQLKPKLRLNTAVASVVWDQARYGYLLTTGEGTREFFHCVISAVGMFARPRYPAWPGLKEFAGEVVHTAQWNDSIMLEGKRVAVVGTGSSAAQVVPAIAPHVAQLTLFQRQPGWLLPKNDRDFSARHRALLKRGWLRKLYRLKLYLVQELREFRGAFFRPGARANTVAKASALSYIDSTFADRPDLARAVTPDYPFAGKRAVMSSDFYPALLRPNVTLVPRAVASVGQGGLTDTAQEFHAADVIVLATGFEATQYLSTLHVVGREGITLNDHWKGEPHAFLGIMVPNFPNFFMLYGPNTNGGFIVTNLERQARFAAIEIKRLAHRKKPSVEVTEAANQQYNDWLQRRIEGTAFVDAKNYFKSDSGRVVTQWPDNATVYALLLWGLRWFGNWRCGD